MRVAVWSHWRGEWWTGDVELDLPIGDASETTAGQVNEALFVFFNRVDDVDHERLEACGYRLPSLSVGDRLTWSGRVFEVMPVGFVEVAMLDDERAS